jgi:hypothetical protein
MIRRICLFVSVAFLFSVGVAFAEHPILNMVADEVIQKYQNSTCEQLWEEKGKPKSERAQEMIKLLRSNPDLRTEFINKVAAPIANKMFECGMLP